MANAQALIDAIRTNDANTLSAMIADGQNVNIRNEKDNTPLHIAAYYGHVEVCQMLLDAGADMHFENKDGCSAMQMAADRVIHPTPDDNGQRAMALLATFVNHNANSPAAEIAIDNEDSEMTADGIIEAIDQAVGTSENEAKEKTEPRQLAPQEEGSSEDIASEMKKEEKPHIEEIKAPDITASEAPIIDETSETEAPEAPKAEEIPVAQEIATQEGSQTPETTTETREKPETAPAAPIEIQEKPEASAEAPVPEAPKAEDTPVAEAPKPATPTPATQQAEVEPAQAPAAEKPVTPEAPKAEETPAAEAPKAAASGQAA